MGWIQRQMNLDVNPEDVLAYMVPHAQLVSQYYYKQNVMSYHLILLTHNSLWKTTLVSEPIFSGSLFI